VIHLRLPVLLLSALFLVTACGGGDSGGGMQQEPNSSGSGGGNASEETTAMASMEETMSGENELTPAEAEVGPDEITNMMPADGEEPDEPQAPPQNPPEGVETYPATTNETVEGPIEYARRPPTNGDHDPLWQNCGFYPEPIEDRHAVHSMDHGVVWISYRSDLPREQVETLRPYGGEDYVIVAPYPGLDAPVVATAWRNQIELEGADDPRLREFVDEFRNTTTAPLSGNRCEGGVGDPA
jgi:hypothetical protein